MDKEQILKLLHELGDELANEESYATIHVCGGAAMAIAYNSLKTSDDIDAVLTDFDSRNIFTECVKRIAKRHKLQAGWLNEDVKIFVNSMREMSFNDFGKFGALSVRITSEEQLLAMKLLAGRRKDLTDAAVLAKSLNINTKEDLNAVLIKYFSERTLNFEIKRFKNNLHFSDFQDKIILLLESGEINVK